MIRGYDLDGVLAEGPIFTGKKWRHMNGEERKAKRQMLLDHYKQARKLYIPLNPFHVITARKATSEVQVVTADWVMNQFGQENILSLSCLNDARTLENVIKFKAKVINGFGIEYYVEDNKSVLNGLSKLVKAELHFYQAGMKEPIPYKPRKSRTR